MRNLFMKLDIQLFATLLKTWRTYCLLSGSSTPDYVDANGRIKAYLESQNIANNTSYIRLDHYIVAYGQSDFGCYLDDITSSYRCNQGSYGGSYKTKTKSSYSTESDSTYSMGSTYHTVTHNSNGTGTLYVNGSFEAIITDISLGAVRRNRTSSFTASLTTIPRYAVITSFVATVLSPSEIQVSWAADVTCSDVDYSTDGGSTWVDPGGSGTSGSFIITGLTTNTTYNLKIRVARNDSGLVTNSSALSRTTHKLCSITSSVNFNIGTDIPITIDRQDSTYVCDIEIQARALDTDIWTSIKSDIIDVEASATVSLSDSEKNAIYALIPNQQAALIQFIVTTKLEDTEYGTTVKSGSAIVVSSNPTFVDFAYQDTNPTTLDITGNNQKLIKGYSNVKMSVSVENKAVAKNYATMNTYSFENVGITTPTPKAYSAVDAVEETLNAIQNANLVVRATDSRGFNTAITKIVSTFIIYTVPTIASILINRTNGVDDETNLIISGAYNNWAGLALSNSIQNAKYRYREIGGSWSGYTNITLSTNANGSYSFIGKLSGDLGASGFDTTKSYQIEVVITDRLSSVTSQLLTLNSAQPLIWKFKNSLKSLLGIGKKPDTDMPHGSIDILGDFNADGDIHSGGDISADGDFYSGIYKLLSENNIVNNLTSTSTTDVLSANQGKVLNDKFSEVVLYAPETPETSGTLTDSVANYDYIEVFYNFGGAKDGGYGNNSVKIYQANNTKAALVLPIYSGGYTYLVTGQVRFSGKTFTSVSPYRTRLATTPGITITNVDDITLYRVVGYKIL